MSFKRVKLSELFIIEAGEKFPPFPKDNGKGDLMDQMYVLREYYAAVSALLDDAPHVQAALKELDAAMEKVEHEWEREV